MLVGLASLEAPGRRGARTLGHCGDRPQPLAQLRAFGGIGQRQAVAGGASCQQQREQGGGTGRDGKGSDWSAPMMIRETARRKWPSAWVH
jgi:hypothetical protein